jgi:hypothetical protein
MFASRNIYPGTQQHTIGAYLHAAPIVMDCELFKFKRNDFFTHSNEIIFKPQSHQGHKEAQSTW